MTPDFPIKAGIRAKEITGLIDHIFAKEFAHSNVIDKDNLVVAGHSMGGAAALKAGNTESRVKHVLTFDPWLAPILKDEISLLSQNKSICLINTSHFQNWKWVSGETFYEFPSKEVVEGFRNALRYKRNEIIHSVKSGFMEDIYLENCTHFDQSDCIIIQELEHQLSPNLAGRFPPMRKCHKLVQMHTWLWLSFLHRAGVGKIDNILCVEENLKSMKPDYVKYKIRYEKK